MRTGGRLLLGVGAFLAIAALVYGITSGEEAGTAMLTLSSVLALMIGVYLVFVGRTARLRTVAPADHVRAGEDEYIPHASIWPFWMGVGALVIGNGLVLGLWALIPGSVIFSASTAGFVRQSRNRD